MLRQAEIIGRTGIIRARFSIPFSKLKCQLTAKNRRESEVCEVDEKSGSQNEHPHAQFLFWQVPEEKGHGKYTQGKRDRRSSPACHDAKHDLVPEYAGHDAPC